MASEVDVGMFQKQSSSSSVSSRPTSPAEDFFDYLLTECVPKIERARQAFVACATSRPSWRAPSTSTAKPAKLQSGLEDYAENIKKRGGVKDVDQLIQETGNAWHSTRIPRPKRLL